MISIDAVKRSLIAGFAATAAMATTTLAQRAISSRRGPLDFDDSLIAVELAEKWTSLDVHGRTETVVNQLMRFGYGSAGGLLLHAIDGRVRHRAVMLFALMWGGEVALLRAVGAAPPPWRWKRATLVTSITQHVIYAYVADRAYRALQTNPPVPTLLVDPDEHTSTRRTSNGRASFDDER